MTADGFNAWFSNSYLALLAMTFQTVQRSVGATIEDAEDGVGHAYGQFRRPDKRYLSRVTDDDPPRMRNPDGTSGSTLLAYCLAVARNEVLRLAGMRALEYGYVYDGLEWPRGRNLSPVAELVVEVRACWSELDDRRRSVFRRRICTNEYLNSGDRALIASAHRLLRLCLLERGLDCDEILDVADDFRTIICDHPETE